MNWTKLIALSAILLLMINPMQAKTTVDSKSMVTVNPEEYARALRNPLKGFTNRGAYENNEWATLMHSYIKWNEIERDSLDDIPEIKEWCETNWAGVEDKNIKVIPRVYLHWDGELTYWPEDMQTYDYTSPQFIRRLKKMIWKLGQCWDTDPRVAHIEMGIIGKWGEHHSPSATEEVQKIMGEAFRQAFPHKKVMVRHPWEFTAYKFGIYWDSWAHQNQVNDHGKGIANLGDRWKTEIIGGETAYNWGDWKIQPGEDPTDTMVDPIHRNFLNYTIRWLHCTQLRWVADYDKSNAAARAGAEEVQKVFGYRFVIDAVTYPSRIDKDQEFTVSFSVRNTGSAPFYYNWPVELSLLDEANKVVWSADFDSVDIRNWLPGDKWLTAGSYYSVPADTFEARGVFKLDAHLNSGRYTLALAVLDPAGRRPSLRFAIKNYLKGGRHPIGSIGVGTDIQSVELDPTKFDDPYLDKTLKYIFDPNLVGVSNKKPKHSIPNAFKLGQNYPNPFNPATRISFDLPRAAWVRLEIYNVLGQRVALLCDSRLEAGNHVEMLNAADDKGRRMSAGLYLYRLSADNFSVTKKMSMLP
jgi:hypothetical protein